MTGLAWMRMMGADSVAYHEHTVAGRGDDPVSAALDYYGSRGETPMTWGGSGRVELGLDSEVDLADWRAVFGPGGPRDPLSGDRLAACRRPGMELVISPHKTVAELGVIGRAEDMHAIADAERHATMAYLDRLVRESGGRRGRAVVRSETGGLIWAVSRHATTRAGDPQVHDHVLVANVVSIRDARGGWKALDTAFLREHLHAATAVGRMAAAAKAVELGYGIEPDGGPSGRLGSWAIAGIPREAWEVHASRSAQIDEAVGPDGSYRARAVAARATRDRKSHDTVEDLVGRWRTELAAAGYPPLELDDRVRRAGLEYQPPGVELVDQVAERLLDPDGALAQEKTFTRGDVIVAVAPLLHGLPVSILDDAVKRVIGHELAVSLPSVAGAGGPVWAAASVVGDEQRIAEIAERLTHPAAARVGQNGAAGAVSRFETVRELRLTPAQRAVAEQLLASTARLDVVVGVAGSGKTTTLAAVRAGLEDAGFEVIGAATSGQAAQTLERGSGIESRTVASLSWRLDNGQLRLGDRHVLILDEAGMTTDADVGRLLGAVERAGARMIVVGDYRQLDAIGPGGALEAICHRHPEIVHTLDQNLRQIDPNERAALDQLRAGRVDTAAGWYGRNGRVHPARNRGHAVFEMVQAWAADIDAGKDSLLLAYRRDSVAALNHTARQAWQALDRLHGPELHTADGPTFQAGDRIITLTPGPGGAWATSQRATITVVDVDQHTVIARTPDGAELRIGPEYLSTDRIAYGYAMTAHRSQGATVDTAHILADGGGRELAYVAMSRARGPSHIHTISPDPGQAVARLAWDWEQQKRQGWTLQPDTVNRPQLVDLYRQHAVLNAAIPPDRSHQLARARDAHAETAQQLEDLYAGRGRFANDNAGHAARAYHAAQRDRELALTAAQNPELGWRARRRAAQQLTIADERYQQALRDWGYWGAPVAERYKDRLTQQAEELGCLEDAQKARDEYLQQHPDALDRLDDLSRNIRDLKEIERQHRIERTRTLGVHHTLSPSPAIQREPDLGLGL